MGHVWILVLWNFRAGAVVAKYGDKSVYFDLEDLGNTTGQWDVYGSDGPSPYNSLQVCDFSFLFSFFNEIGGGIGLSACVSKSLCGNGNDNFCF